MAHLGRIMGVVACVVMIAVGFGGLALLLLGLIF